MPRKFIHAGSLSPSGVYTQVGFSKSACMWKTYLWSTAVIPWKLCLWFWTLAPRRTCWSLVLSWWNWVPMVLALGIEQGLRLYKEKETIRQRIGKDLNIWWNIRSSMQVIGWWRIAWSELRRDLIGWWRTRSKERLGSNGLKWTIFIWLIMRISRSAYWRNVMFWV